MSNYVKTTDFAEKDSLASGNLNKIVSGVEIDNEFNAIQTAVATKANTASPTFSGTINAVNLTVSGTLAATLTGTVDGGTY